MDLDVKVDLAQAKQRILDIEAKQKALGIERSRLETQVRLAEKYGLYIGGRYTATGYIDYFFQLVSVQLSEVSYVGLDDVRVEEYIQSVTVREIDRYGRLRSPETIMIGYPAKDANIIFDQI